MSELRAGGLALVIGAPPANQDQIGRVVTLIRLVQPGLFTHEGRTIRLVRGPAWICKIDGLNACIPPHRLKPIEGDNFSHEDERQKELTHG